MFWRWGESPVGALHLGGDSQSPLVAVSQTCLPGCLQLCPFAFPLSHLSFCVCTHSFSCLHFSVPSFVTSHFHLSSSLSPFLFYHFNSAISADVCFLACSQPLAVQSAVFCLFLQRQLGALQAAAIFRSREDRLVPVTYQFPTRWRRNTAPAPSNCLALAGWESLLLSVTHLQKISF